METSYPATEQRAVGRSWRFWLIFTSVALSSFLAALDLTAVSVALPNITAELDGTDFTWIGGESRGVPLRIRVQAEVNGLKLLTR